ncbi:Matrix metalloproteinase-14-like protein, partial [Dinothrombium tinctorium]
MPPEIVLITFDDFHRSLRLFQLAFGLNRTGKLDEQTLAAMRLPRCGNLDLDEAPNAFSFDEIKGRNGDSPEFSILSSKWSINNLTYKVKNVPSYLNRDEIMKTFSDALLVWSNLANVDFTALEENDQKDSNIEIVFTIADHGDGKHFDGKGGIVLHVFHPIQGGDIHFDSDEEYTLDESIANASHLSIRLKPLFLHAMGHALGLGHNYNKSSIMHPLVGNMNTNASEVDAASIQLLYGVRNGSEDFTRDLEVGLALDEYSLCLNSSFDAITKLPDGRLSVFVDRYYWLVELNYGILSGYPHKVEDDFGSLSGKDLSIALCMIIHLFLTQSSKLGNASNCFQ